MKTFSTILKTLLAGAFFSVVTNGSAQDQDGLIALGTVNADASVHESFTTFGGTVSVTNQSEGSFRLTIESPGAFATLDFQDLYIHVTSLNNEEVTANAQVSSKTDDLVRFQVYTQEVDNDTSVLSSQTPVDAPFSFTVFRTPASGASRYLAATGTVNADGSPAGGTTVGGYTLSSVRTAPNRYNLNLTKPGGIVDGPAEDNTIYVIHVTSLGSGTDDESFISYPLPVINGVKGFQVDVKDQQAGADPGDPTDGQPFYYVIYRVDPAQIETQPKSNRLIALAKVDFTGDLDSNPSPVSGTTVTSSRPSSGNFFVNIQSPGRFAGYSSTDLSLMLSHHFANNSDKIVIGTITVVDANEVIVHVTPNDVQAHGAGTGVPSSSGFFLQLLDAKRSTAGGAIQPDLRIGAKRSLSKMKGDNRINNSGGGQQVKIELRGKRLEKFYFALENDGSVADDILLKESGAGRYMKTKFFRLDGGKRNITGEIARSGYVQSNLAPGETVLYQGGVKYKGTDKRPRQKIKLSAQSLMAPAKRDTVRAITKAK